MCRAHVYASSPMSMLLIVLLVDLLPIEELLEEAGP